MAYNYPFPATYQNPYQVQPIQQPQNSSSIIWVQGEAGAKAYPVAPSNSVLLMDSEDECFYIKSTDASGIPMPLRTFSYTERKEKVHTPQEVSNSIDTSNFITRDEFNELKKTIESMQTMKPSRKENKNEPLIPRNSTKHNAE